MRAEELMIGDWVQIVEPCKYAGARGTIKTLIDHKDDENAYFKVFLRNNPIHIGIEDICSDDICPIPLTSEILEKNGFKMILDEQKIPIYRIKWSRNPYLYFTIFTGVDGYFNPSGFGVAIGGVNGVVDYVHQLQHALKLCGINKEIVL